VVITYALQVPSSKVKAHLPHALDAAAARALAYGFRKLSVGHSISEDTSALPLTTQH